MITLLIVLLGNAFGLHHRGPAKFCWDDVFKPNAKVFHLHTPKVAGCSVVEDLSHFIGRKQIYSKETCFSQSLEGSFQDTVVMVRRPRDHVFAMYQHCHNFISGSFRWEMHIVRQFPGMEDHHVPRSFNKWVAEWQRSPRFGDHHMLLDKDFCYCPYNMQTSRLVCKESHPRAHSYCYEKPDLDEAMKNLKAATLLGVVEAYHESFCLFHAHFLRSLPDSCKCESPTWSSFSPSDHHHGYSYNQTIEDMPQETIEKVDEMTTEDMKLYKAAVKRFIDEIEKVEQHFGSRVLCNNQRQNLQQMAGLAG